MELKHKKNFITLMLATEDKLAEGKITYTEYCSLILDACVTYEVEIRAEERSDCRIINFTNDCERIHTCNIDKSTIRE